jgi:hypothetical protein
MGRRTDSDAHDATGGGNSSDGDSMKPIVLVLVSVSLLSLVTYAPRDALSQQPQQPTQQIYIIPRETQAFAIQNNLYRAIGDANPSLYVDTLTAVDVVATTRAASSRRGAPILEDYQAAAWAWCILPWSPPKKPSDKAVMDKARPMLVQGAFTSETRRAEIVKRLNRDLLSLSQGELTTRGVYPQQIINIGSLPR